MKNLIKKFLWGFIIALGLWSVFALNYIWTSFFKVGNPITLPATQFVSWWVASGNYTSWGTLLMQIGQSGSIYAYVPILDGSGNTFLTGGAVSGTYLLISQSWVYFNANSWTYFVTHSWEYFEANSGTYFNLYSGDYFNTAISWYATHSYVTNAISGFITGYTETDPVFMIHSGDYTQWTWNDGLLCIWTGWLINCNTTPSSWWVEVDPVRISESGNYLKISNSWDYFDLYSGDYYTTNPLWYITGWQETDPICMADSGNRNDAYDWIDTNSGNALRFINNSWDYVWMSLTGNWNNAYNRINTNSWNALSFVTNSWNYCLLSGDQTFTWTINIASLYDWAGNRYLTGISSFIVKSTNEQRTGATTGFTITNTDINSGSILMGRTITSGTQIWYWTFTMTGWAINVVSTTWENVTFSYTFYK